MLSTLTGNGRGWSPRRITGLVAWFEARRNSVILDSNGDVATWVDPTTGATIDGGGGAPDWLPNGWGSGVPALGLASGLTGMSTTSATLVNPGSGTDVAFSIFCTIQPTAEAAHVIACWQHSVGSSLSCLQMLDGADAGKVRYRRIDSGATAVNVDGTTNLGFLKRRIGLFFFGTTADIYVDRSREASGASDVGALTPDTFKIATGPGVDSFTGFMADFVLVNRAAPLQDYLAYESWSRATYGT